MAALKTLSNLFDRLRKQKADEDQTAEQLYRQLVKQIAKGKEPSTDEVMPVLADAGRSVADLEADVQLEQQRQEWRDQLAEIPGLRAREKEINEILTNEANTLRDAQVRYDSLSSSLLIEQREVISPKISKAKTARQKLWKTASAEFSEQLKSVDQNEMSLKEHRRNLNDDLEKLRVQEKNTYRKLQSNPHDKDIARDLSAIRRRLTEIPNEIQTINDAIAAVQLDANNIITEGIAS